MNQQEIWDNIAPEWHEFKTKPAKHTIEFLKKASGNVLDLGSGSGRHLVNIKNGKMYLVDFSEEMLKLAKAKIGNFCITLITSHKAKIGNFCINSSLGKSQIKAKSKKEKINAEFIQANLWELPFKNNFFDYAICISSLHCIESAENRKKAIKELYRVLKPEALAEIGVWNKNSKRFKNLKGKEKYVSWRDKGKRYYYLYEEKEIHEQFKKAGFKIISTHNSEMMINFVAQV